MSPCASSACLDRICAVLVNKIHGIYTKFNANSCWAFAKTTPVFYLQKNCSGSRNSTNMCARVVCAHTDLINQSEPSSCQGPIRLKNVTLINSNDLSCQYFWGFFLLSVFFSFYKSCKKKKLRKRHFNQFYIDSDFQKQPSIKAAREAGFRRI